MIGYINSGLVVHLDDEVVQYGREALTYGLYVWEATPLMITWGPRVLPGALWPVHRATLYGAPFSRAPLWAAVQRRAAAAAGR